MARNNTIKEQIRNEATRLGFEGCGFARVRRLDSEARFLEQWLREQRHGKMSWMEQHFEKRVDPARLVPGAKTVVSLFCSYNRNEKKPDDQEIPIISKYALGDDYHLVLKDKLSELFHFTQSVAGEVQGRIFVDSAPVMDKVWAVEAGLGWMGKNANILNKDYGSFFFLAEMIIDLELEPDSPETDHCGTCTLCIESCPTEAIYEPYKIDGSRCISYLTIELREQIPDSFHQQIGNWIFGCDICQDVCPWNRKAEVGREKRFEPRPDISGRSLDFWEELDLSAFNEIFRKSAVKRTKFEGLKRNITIASNNIRNTGRNA